MSSVNPPGNFIHFQTLSKRGYSPNKVHAHRHVFTRYCARYKEYKIDTVPALTELRSTGGEQDIKQIITKITT